MGLKKTAQTAMRDTTPVVAPVVAPKAKAKGKQSQEARECAAILKGLHESCEAMGGVEALREKQEKRIADFKAKKEQPKPKAKGKKAPEPIDPLTAAIREYERASYYLATKGYFSFATDDEAQRLFHTFDPANAKLIMELRDSRVKGKTGQRMIPAGDHLKGLAIRTDERMKRNKKKGGK